MENTAPLISNNGDSLTKSPLKSTPGKVSAKVQSPASRVVLREVSPIKNTQSSAATPKSNSTPSVVQFSREFVEDIYDPASSTADVQSIASAEVSCTDSFSNFDTASVGPVGNDTDSDISFESASEALSNKHLKNVIKEENLNESYGLSSVINNLQNLHIETPKVPRTHSEDHRDIKSIFVDGNTDDSFVSSTEDFNNSDINLNVTSTQVDNINNSFEEKSSSVEDNFENSENIVNDNCETVTSPFSETSEVIVNNKSEIVSPFSETSEVNVNNKSEIVTSPFSETTSVDNINETLPVVNSDVSFVVDPESEIQLNLSYVPVNDPQLFNKLVEEDKSTFVDVSFAVDEQAAAEILKSQPIHVENNSSFSHVEDIQVNVSVDQFVDNNQQEFVEANQEAVDDIQVNVSVDQFVDNNQQQFVDNNQQEFVEASQEAVDDIQVSVSVDQFVDNNQQEFVEASQEAVDDIQVNVSVDQFVDTNQQEFVEASQEAVDDIQVNVSVDQFVDTNQQEFVEASQEAVDDIQVNVSVDQFVDNNQQEVEASQEAVDDIQVNVSVDQLVDNNQQEFVEVSQEKLPILSNSFVDEANISVDQAVDNNQQEFVEAGTEVSPLPELSTSFVDAANLSVDQVVDNIQINTTVDNNQQEFVEVSQDTSQLPELSTSTVDEVFLSVNKTVDNSQQAIVEEQLPEPIVDDINVSVDKSVDNLSQNFGDISIKESVDEVSSPSVASVNFDNQLINSQQESTLSELLSLCSKQQQELENYQEEVVETKQVDSVDNNQQIEQPTNELEQSQVEQEQPSFNLSPEFYLDHPVHSPKQPSVDETQQIKVVIVDQINGEQSQQQIKVVCVPEVNSEQPTEQPLNQQQVDSPKKFVVDETQQVKVVLVEEVNSEQPVDIKQEVKVVLVDEVNREQPKQDLEDLLEAEANRVCEEIHNASLKFEEDFEMNDSLEIKSQTRRSASPRHASPAPGNDDPFKARTRIASSPPRDVSSLPASLTSSSDSAVHVNPGRLHREASSESAGGSPKSIPSMDSGICGAEVNQSEAGPDIAPAEEQFVSSEIFKDPNAFDFLCKLGGQTATSISSRLERESLFVKFDPLVSSRDRKVYLSPCLEKSRGENSMSEDSPARGDTSSHNTIGTLINIGTPVQQEQATTLAANKGDTPRRGGTDTEPSLAQVQFAQELLDRQKRVFEERLAQLEKQLEDTKLAHDGSRQVIAKQAQQLSAKAESEDQMRMVMREYEDTISRIVVDKEHAAKAWIKEKETLEAERNQATSDLAGAELAFTDLHQKYERAKVALQGMKKNEQELRGSNEKFQEQLVQANDRYKKLKHHAEEQLQKANDEIETLARNKELENAALSGQVKQLKTKVANLENMLTLKSKENTELVAICDELVAKLGSAAHQ